MGRFREAQRQPALFLHEGDTLASAMWIESGDDRITAIHALRHGTGLLVVTRQRAPRPCTDGDPSCRGWRLLPCTGCKRSVVLGDGNVALERLRP